MMFCLHYVMVRMFVSPILFPCVWQCLYIPGAIKFYLFIPFLYMTQNNKVECGIKTRKKVYLKERFEKNTSLSHFYIDIYDQAEAVDFQATDYFIKISEHCSVVI